jgi:stage 0 sporulation regulatory protein
MDPEIEKKRQQLIELAAKHGLTSSQTLRCSRELDRLLDFHQERLLKTRTDTMKIQL